MDKPCINTPELGNVMSLPQVKSAENRNRLSAFKPVYSKKQMSFALVAVQSGYNFHARGCNRQKSPLSALEDFVANYFTEESVLEADRVLLSKSRSFNPRLTKGSTNSTKKFVFSEVQIMTLEDSFNFKQYLSPPSRKWLANLLGVSKRQVVTWFQNRRAKERKRAGIKLPKHGKKCVLQQ